MVGCVISHYEILEELGRGGMGIVYRAHDQVLERTVAIKVLPPSSLNREKDRSRFFREARAAASLQHTNIASVYEIDEAIPSKLIKRPSEHERLGNLVELDVEAEPRLFIAMEYIEGLSVADCIDAGEIPLKTAASLARQVADGLAVAHEQGVVHRDIKPSNVMVTGKMEAKILDFGIARQLGVTRSTEDTRTSGTIAYMSPEQAMGEDLDHRSDIWSLGVLIYEMVSGKRPFRGAYEQAIVYMIVNADAPPVSTLRPDVPEILDFILGKCLAKNPEDRYQSASELAVDLRSAEVAARQIHRVMQPQQQSKKSAAAPISLGLALVALCFYLVGHAAGFLTYHRPHDIPETNTKLPLPAFHSLSNTEPSKKLLAISPQGTHIAHIDGGRIRIRPLSDFDNGRILEEPTSASGVFFSPDGQSVAYHRGTDGMLVTQQIRGGLERPIVQVGDMHGGYWASPTDIVYAAGERGIFQVSINDREPEQLVPADPSGSYIYTSPQLFPEENKLVFTRITKDAREEEGGDVFVRDLDSNPPNDILVWRGFRNAQVVQSGHMVGYNRGTLYAREFSISSPELTLDAAPVVSSVLFSFGYTSQNKSYTVPTGDLHFSVSDDGTAIYLSAETSMDRSGHLVVVDSRGQSKKLTYEAGEYVTPSASRDGKWIVVSGRLEGDDGFRLYRVDLESGDTQAFTSAPTIMPVIDPSDRWVYFSRQVDGQYDLYRKRLEGEMDEEPFLELPREQFITDFNGDGTQFLMFSNVNRGQRDIEICTTVDQKCRFLFDSEFDERNAVFSPQSDLISFTSDRSGISEVYVAHVDSPQDAIQVSEGGGHTPAWSKDGKRIYYYRMGVVLVSEVDPDTGEPSPTSEMFPSDWFPNYYLPGDFGRMTMNASGSGFLLFEEEVSDDKVVANIMLEQHWFQEIDQELASE